MGVDPGFVRKIFAGLEHGDGAGFFAHVADDVDWTVMGTHPLARHYLSKADFVAGTFAKLGKVLPNGAQLHVDNLIVQDDVAIVELHSEATAKTASASIIITAGFAISAATPSCACAPISIRRWWRGCLRRIRSSFVARMERSAIRDQVHPALRAAPDFAPLHPGYKAPHLPLNTGLRFSMKACTASL